MNPLFGYFAAFFLGSFVRRMLGYGSVVYGFEVLGGGDWSGAFYLALLLPYLLFSLHAGALIDTVPKLRVLRVTVTSAVVLLTGLLVVEWAGWGGSDATRGGWIAALLFAFGTAYAVGYPTYIAAIPELAPASAVPRATVTINLLAIVSMAYAPLAVGLLREALDWRGIFGVLVGLSAIAWVALQGARFPAVARAQANTRSVGTLRELFRHCWQHPRVPALLWLVVVFNALLVGPLEVLLPQFAERDMALSPFAAGAFMAAGGTGLVLGAVLALRLVRQRWLGAWLCGMGAGASVLIVAMSCAPVWAAFPLLFGSGVLGGAFSSVCLAAAQANADAGLRGSVIAVFSLASGGVPALGGAGAALLAEVSSVALMIRVCFGAAAVLFAVAFAARALRQEAWIESPA